LRNDDQHLELPHPALALGYQPLEDHQQLESRILKAMKIMANIIKTHGDVYLPLFLRLEQELEQHRSKKFAMKRVASFMAEEPTDFKNPAV